jgi:hypothetical protein
VKKGAAGWGLLLLLTTTALGWQPSGWVYANHPYVYDRASGEWHWFAANRVQWTCQVTDDGGMVST